MNNFNNSTIYSNMDTACKEISILEAEVAGEISELIELIKSVEISLDEIQVFLKHLVNDYRDSCLSLDQVLEYQKSNHDDWNQWLQLVHKITVGFTTSAQANSALSIFTHTEPPFFQFPLKEVRFTKVQTKKRQTPFLAEWKAFAQDITDLEDLLQQLDKEPSERTLESNPFQSSTEPQTLAKTRKFQKE